MAIMVRSLGHAGQPGYVFKTGERVKVTDANNLPCGGYFVEKLDGSESVHIAKDELNYFIKDKEK